MKVRALVLLSLLLLVAAAILGQGRAPLRTSDVPTAEQGATELRVANAYGKLPLSFEANQGQTDEQVKFLSRGGGYTLFLTSTEAVLVLRKAEAPPPQHATDAMPMTREAEIAESSTQTVLRMKLLGANRDPQVVGLEKLPTKSNYFIGNDPKKWRTNVAHYRKVKLQNVYPGIDLVYYGTNQRQLEYDFIVAPGADPKAITLNFEGADNLEVDAQGDLLLHFEDGDLRFRKPYLYQESNGARHEIAGGYLLKGENEIAFEVASYDASWPLVIDPVLSFSTYLGGSGFDEGFAIAVDPSGNPYVTGITRSINFPKTDGVFDNDCGTDGNCNFGVSDIYVTKFNAAGSALVYSTFIGGSSFDNSFGIDVDAAGNAYLTGATQSINDFPTVNALQPTSGGGSTDAFVTVLNPTGSALLYSTYLGGSIGFTQCEGIAVDSSGNVYVTGRTSSFDFPTTPGAFKTTMLVPTEAFVTKLNPSFSGAASLVYSTFLGGNSTDRGFAIAVDSSGNAYVTGRTSSSDFPLVNPVQGALRGLRDVFVTKFNATGSALVYSTYLGGSGTGFEDGLAIAVDSSDNTYVTGSTSATDFPTANAFQPSIGGGSDAFVTKLDPTGSVLVYSTYLGGNSTDLGHGIAVDASGNAVVTGTTFSTNFPMASPIQGAKAGDFDTFVTKVNADGSTLTFSTYLGGSGRENPQFRAGIAVDSFGDAYVVGSTQSSNFPTKNAFQGAIAGFRDAFVAKITLVIQPDIVATTNRGELVEIDLDTKTARLVGDAGFFEGRELGWTGLSFDSSGSLFVTSRAGSELFTDGCKGHFADGRCSHLYRIDPATGAILAEIGSTGIAFLSDIDFAPDGTLYGNHFIDQRSKADGGLVTIDPSAAAVTEFGRFGKGSLKLGNGGLSVHPQTGEIWAVESSFSESPSIFRVDPVTGLAIPPVVRLGLSGVPTSFGLDALEILPNGRFIATRGRSSELYGINPVPDEQSGLAELTLISLDIDTEITGSLNGLESLLARVDIDIKPGSDLNAVNPADSGLTSVAILTTDTFDATTVSPITVRFGPAGASLEHQLGHLKDVDGDGDLDLVLHFRTQETGILCGDTEASLTGETFEGQAIQGSDSIVTVGCN